MSPTHRARYLGACLVVACAACGAPPPELARVSFVLDQDPGEAAGALRALESAYLEVDSDTLGKAIVRRFAEFPDEDDEPCALEASLTHFHGNPASRRLCLSDDFLRLFADKTLLFRRVEMTFKTEKNAGVADDIYVRGTTITPQEAERGTQIVVYNGGHTHKLDPARRPGHSREKEALRRPAESPEAEKETADKGERSARHEEVVLEEARKPRRRGK